MKKPKAAAKKLRGQTPTYAMSSTTAADPSAPFTLPVRQPGWFPDGLDVGTKKCQRLFLEEVAGIGPTDILGTLPVEFDYDGTSKKWILGSHLDETKSDGFSTLVRKLAVRIRQYNASLYRLRRLHVYWDYQDRKPQLTQFPKRNPHGDPNTTPDPKTDLTGFKKMLKDAEADWIKVTGQVNELLETAYSAGNSFGVQLIGADMIGANGYVVSMRVVGNPTVTVGVASPEVGGSSSSHVSVSSAFSSSSQIP